ncbi:MAG TPA: EAL domain-containing protein [Burkholderiaceae bacterium]|nr:EAL domain-containing protein [Burkholderiaceae bacterium]
MPTNSSDRQTTAAVANVAAAADSAASASTAAVANVAAGPDAAEADLPVSQLVAGRELIQRAGEMLRTAAASRAVLLVLSLNRSDRLLALAQDQASRPVMLEVVRRVRGILRTHDRYAIVSHDEIWLLLADLPTAALAELAARTLQQTLSRPIHVDHGRRPVVQLRPLVGAAWMAQSLHADPMVLLAAAAEACQNARRAEDHVVITRLESDEHAVNRNELEAELRAALQGNDLEVYYQPQIDLKTRRCVAVEALIRWEHPTRGMVSPQLIASMCEERGMIGQLTQFVLNNTLRHQMFWRTQSIDVSAAINITAMSLADATFPGQVQQALATWSADPRRLTLELTESSIVENERLALEFMNELARLGCHLAIDDFGTGYSSFAYLRQFPLNELKIDQMFVRNILKEEGDQRIVHALVDLAHTFEMRALAEGVETLEAADLLEQMGCDIGQGYHFSRPVPAKQFPLWYHQYHKSLVQQPAEAAA